MSSPLFVFSSSSFNWIGFTGFSSVNRLGVRPVGADDAVVTELLVKSEKTGAVVSFRFSHRVWSYTGAVASYVYDGWTDDGKQLSVIVFNDAVCINSLGNS
jgi:hypothetical protein